MWAFDTVANLLLYIDKWRLSWTWLLPRVFELTGIRDLYYLSEKTVSSSRLWLARNVQLRGVH